MQRLTKLLVRGTVNVCKSTDRTGYFVDQHEERNRRIKESVLSGMSLQEAAATWGVSRQRVYQIVGTSIKGRTRTRVNEDAIISLAQSGMATKTIGETLKISPFVVRSVLRKTGTSPKNLTWLDVLKRLENGESAPDIAVATGQTLSNVRRIKELNGIRKRHRITTASPKRSTIARDESIWREFSEGKTVSSLAEQHGLSKARLYQILAYERAKAIRAMIEE